MYDGLNQLRSATGEGGGTFDYDTMGNMVSATSGGETVRYEYDLRYQLSRVSLGDGSIVGQYEYDYAKRRIARKTGDYQVWNVYAGSGLLNEYATAYVGTNVLTSRNDVTWGENEAIQTSWRGYQFTDALGSVTQTSTGAEIEYDAFGGIKTRSDAPDAQADTLTKIAASRVGYTGQFFDPETGLLPLGNGERYYNPKIGRFIQADSMFGDAGNPMSLNRYSYGHNNPQGNVDPSGNEIVTAVIIGVTLGLMLWQGLNSYEEHRRENEEAISRGADPSTLPSPWALALSDATGMTSVFRGVTGTDPYTGRDLSFSERGAELFEGLLSVTGLGADLMAGMKFVGVSAKLAGANARIVGKLGRVAEAFADGSRFASTAGRGLEEARVVRSEARASRLVEEETSAGRAAMREADDLADDAARAEGKADDIAGQERGGSAPSCMRCFTEGTEVIGEEGDSSRIERVKAGDRVASADESGQTVSSGRVARTFARIVPETLKLKIQGEPKALEVSPDHPFFAKRPRSNTSGEKDGDGEWREAFRLRVGDLVKTRSGKWVRVLRVTHLKQPKVVYNFEVAKSHTYFVGKQGVLVHNTENFYCTPEGAPKRYRGEAQRAKETEISLAIPRAVDDDEIVEPLKLILYSMEDAPSLPIKGQRGKALTEAWELEKELLRRTGRGTYPWNKREIRRILAGDDMVSIGVTGHHLNRVEDYKLWRADPRNIVWARQGPGDEHMRIFHPGGTNKPQPPKLLIDRQAMLNSLSSGLLYPR